MTVHILGTSVAGVRPAISPDLSGELRIVPVLKLLSKSVVFNCQAAWITMRRRVTMRLIGIQSV